MTFKDALRRKDFVVTAHVSMAEARDADSLIRQGEILRPVVDAVQLTDSTQLHMSGIAAASIAGPNASRPPVGPRARRC